MDSSNKWSYKTDSKLESKNIKQYIFDTSDFNTFVEKSFEKFKELSKTEKFDAIMTRSLPPESQFVGLKIKEINKDIPWIVSLGDPIANNPYETKPYLLEKSDNIKFLNTLGHTTIVTSFKILDKLFKS